MAERPRAAPGPSATRRLARYRERRDFSRTPEPPDIEPETAAAPQGQALSYVIQKHAATRLHYDFRLELDGVLLSWAVPKGPSLDPAHKRMAVRTEDHPLAYGGFEGSIPAGHYGAGEVILWDRGHWEPQGDPHAGLRAGKLAFELHGQKLQGLWELVRMQPREGQKETWLLIKRRDDNARAAAEFDIVSALPDRVAEAPAPSLEPQKAPPKAPLPETLAPQLAQLATGVPAAGRWLFETKFDGYRLLARIADGRPQLLTRAGHDWSERLPALVEALAALELDTAWLDGELIATQRAGGDFNALQNAFAGEPATALEYRLFDLPYFEGHDLREAPLYARRTLLAELLARAPHPLLQLSAELGEASDASAPARAEALLREACRAGLEGLIAKRADAPYRSSGSSGSSRSADWLKLKCHQRQEFVIGGYTVRSDDSQAVGSLLLGVHDAAGRLRPAGNVGTGWSRATARRLLSQLAPLARKASPFDDSTAPGRWGRRSAGREQWVAPRLVAEVSFGEWTPAGHIRHASFIGLRTDKPAGEISREQAAPPPPAALLRGVSVSVNVSHGERVIDAATGATKLDLLRYYDSVADFLLPHLAGRPVALLRGPQGVDGPQFFQKHPGKGSIPGVRELDAALWPGHEPLLEISTREGLLHAAQMNAIEFHTWNTHLGRRASSLTAPDRLVFDLDPGEGVSWPTIREGATLTRALLAELGLEAWLKTSGGKGLHLVVPIASRWSFATVKAFAKAVVGHLARTVPQRFVVKSGPANRRGRIFVDYLRNGEGATTVAAFSVRARPGLGVSMPLAWDELAELKSAAQWTLANARDHLSMQRADPWAGMAQQRQSLAGPMRKLGMPKAE